jgi:hypothetical protein
MSAAKPKTAPLSQSRKSRTQRIVTMKIKLSILTIMAVCATVPACADPYKVKVNPPICETTVVSRVYHAGPPGDGFTGNSRCGACASGIAYANGKGQSGEYSYVPAMERSRVGDRVRLCLVSFLAGCPAGDDRGHEYTATNLRTHETWKRHDASHMCGGA